MPRRSTLDLARRVGSAVVRILLGTLGALAVACSADPVSPAVRSVAPPAHSVVSLGASATAVATARATPGVVVGTGFACALRADAVVECWGPKVGAPIPATRTASASAFKQISAGAEHLCGLRQDGRIECWGNNEDGQAPALRSPPTNYWYLGVTAGAYHSCALRSDGSPDNPEVECWGANTSGQAPGVTHAPTLGMFEFFAGYSQVSAGATHSCGRTNTSRVFCWGSNQYGKAPWPLSPPPGESFAAVTAGPFHTCALTRSGMKLVCVGYNAHGQLNTAWATSDTRYTAVALGNEHTCALRIDGAVVCWGDNAAGQAPGYRRPASGSYTQLAAADRQTCALRGDGLVDCWGTVGTNTSAALARDVRAPQAIGPVTLTLLPSGHDFAVSVAASSGLPVTLTSLTPNVCTVRGATVTVVGAGGACGLVADQPGDAQFKPASTVTTVVSLAVPAGTS